MKYNDFEQLISPARMSRYLIACNNNTRQSMTLYRYNLKLSQELFTIESCFEIILRNAINNHCITNYGNDWLRDSISQGGIFQNSRCRTTAQSIQESLTKLGAFYTHDKLVAELGFGFWRYMFAQHQFVATGSRLLRIFPGRPAGSPGITYNQSFVFNLLKSINNLRNRIAHHEPICFQVGTNIKSTIYARQRYAELQQLFQWMSVDESSLLYGLDHVIDVCNKIDQL
jgi:hypothetical protein